MCDQENVAVVVDNCGDLVQPMVPVTNYNLEGRDDEGTFPENSKSPESSNYYEVPLILSGLLAIAIDPLFFYVPTMDGTSTCADIDKTLMIVAIILRTCADIIHDLLWWCRSRAPKGSQSGNEGANKESVSPSKRLKIFKIPCARARPKTSKSSDPCIRSIAQAVVTNLTCLKNSQILSPEGRSSTEARVMAIIASIPLPQVVVVAVGLQHHLKTCLKFVVICQLVPRILRIYPSFVAATRNSSLYALIGASFNILLFALAGHALGGFWYLRSVERRMDCLEVACQIFEYSESSLYCQNGYYNYNITNVLDFCATGSFNYGMYDPAIESNLLSRRFILKLSRSFWWGLNSLSSFGLNIGINDRLWDTVFAVFICIFGLILSALLIGNAQMYLQSSSPPTVAKLKDKRGRLQNWPPFFCLPKQMREEIILCQHPKWQEVSEVDIKCLLNNVPWQLRMKLKPHFSEKLFHKVKEFEELDGKIKDALRERANAVVYQAEADIYKEGYPLYKMMYIVQGKVLAFKNNDANDGLLVEELTRGDSFGKELLLRALESPLPKLPFTKQTIQAVTKVEAFTLSFDDFVKVFTKYGRSVPPYRKKWILDVFRGAVRKCIAVHKLKKSDDEGEEET